MLKLQRTAHRLESQITAVRPMYAMCHEDFGLLSAIVEEDVHSEEGSYTCEIAGHKLKCAVWP